MSILVPSNGPLPHSSEVLLNYVFSKYAKVEDESERTDIISGVVLWAARNGGVFGEQLSNSVELLGFLYEALPDCIERDYGKEGLKHIEVAQKALCAAAIVQVLGVNDKMLEGWTDGSVEGDPFEDDLVKLLFAYDYFLQDYCIACAVKDADIYGFGELHTMFSPESEDDKVVIEWSKQNKKLAKTLFATGYGLSENIEGEAIHDDSLFSYFEILTSMIFLHCEDVDAEFVEKNTHLAAKVVRMGVRAFQDDAVSTSSNSNK